MDALPAPILIRPEPDRNGLLQTQSALAKGSSTNLRHPHRGHRRHLQPLQSRRMQQLRHKSSIRVLLTARCSSPPHLDNLGSHKGKAARKAIRDAGAHLIFLPAYSPDLNPIEQFFAKLKHLLRDASPRTVEETWRKAGQLLDLFTPQECKNDPRNSGYASVQSLHALTALKAGITMLLIAEPIIPLYRHFAGRLSRKAETPSVASSLSHTSARRRIVSSIVAALISGPRARASALAAPTAPGAAER
jgi:transposase